MQMMKLRFLFLGLLATVECPAANVEAGKLLVSDKNCTACHAASKEQAAWLSPNVAPRLGDIGNRTNPAWVKKHLLAPKNTMPDVLRGLPAAERDTAADALTHYLFSVSAAKWQPVAPDKGAVARGESVYHRVGCVACHAPQNGAADGEGSVPLVGMTEKWSLGGLRSFLLNPLATHPSGRMPSLGLTDGEALDVAQYLLRATKVHAPLEVAVYRARIRSLEDLDTAEVFSTVPMSNFSLAVPGANGRLALRFNGWLRVDHAGDYTFHLTADGSARISLDEKWTADQDAWTNDQTKTKSKFHLEAGWHPLKLDFSQRGKLPPKLSVEWEGPGITRELVSMARMRADRDVDASLDIAPFVVDAVKAARGKVLYAQMNCATCHEGKPSATALPTLAAMQVGRGCLADQPTANAPDFHFSKAQRSALQAALGELKHSDLAAPSPQQRVAQTMASFRCTSCHKRDGEGGVAKQRDAFFTANVDDLGDEGRVPPLLDGVGDRLRPEWLAKVLAQESSVRPYMNTRMPQFGAANVGNLTELFIALDRHAQPLAPVNDAAEVLREAGRQLVGTDGLSCVACHRFARQPAHMLHVLDLTTVTARLNEDWFRAFLRDPNRYHSATRMPSFWPGGHSVIPAVLGGDTERQHAALWAYLAEGDHAKFPEGLSRKNMELVVGGEPVVYRGKLWEAGFRAIAVGFPGQSNLAFDAEEMRLALLWHGRFLDASPHWSVQGMGSIHPLGKDPVIFPRGSTFAFLSNVSSPWPAASGKEVGMKFRGYQMDSLKRPTLLYSIREIAVEDSFTNMEVDGKPALHRALKFSGPPMDELWFRAALGMLAPNGPNSWRLLGNDGVTIHVTAGGNAIARGEGARQEVIVPIRIANQKTQLEIDYVW